LAGQGTVYENEYQHLDGSRRNAIVTYIPHIEPDGQVPGFYVLRADITERKRAKERFRQVVEQAPNGMVMVDPDGKIVLVNAQVEAAFGYRRDELLGQSIDLLVPISCRAAHAAYRQGYLTNPTARPMGVGRDLSGLRKDGSEFPVEIGLTPIETEQGMMVLGTIVDISERKRAAESQARLLQEIDQQHTRLRTLNRTLASAQERERQELARELHDRVGQSLTALGLGLKVIQAQLSGRVADADPVSARLSEARVLVGQLTEQVRDVMSDLRPPMLGDYGLLATLKWYASQFTRQTDLAIAVRGEEAVPRLAEEIELNLFRIVQEALNNVVKHAQATQVTVTLAAKGQSIRLTVADNGRGMVPTLEVDPTQGWGMLTMRERTLSVGGHFWIKSGPDQGTTIGVEVER
jgi:two-component system sensor kinase